MERSTSVRATRWQRRTTSTNAIKRLAPQLQFWNLLRAQIRTAFGSTQWQRSDNALWRPVRSGNAVATPWERDWTRYERLVSRFSFRLRCYLVVALFHYGNISLYFSFDLITTPCLVVSTFHLVNANILHRKWIKWIQSIASFIECMFLWANCTRYTFYKLDHLMHSIAKSPSYKTFILLDLV